VLNSYTQWDYGDLMDMPVDELVLWLDEARRVYGKG